MSINKLLDVEEHVWSPMYGLKGNIDATVQVTMQDEEGERTLVVPFEVKTGKNTSSTSHRAQTALYTLLLSDRYGNRFPESHRRIIANVHQTFLLSMASYTIWRHPKYPGFQLFARSFAT